MVQVTSAEFQRQIGRYQDAAMGGESVVITSRGRPRLVMMSVDEYERLKAGRRRKVEIVTVDKEFLEALAAVEIRPEMARYDDEDRQ